MAEKIYDVLIVGAGTAGLSAAIYALRSGKSVLVLEEKMYGGQIVVTPEIDFLSRRRISAWSMRPVRLRH